MYQTYSAEQQANCMIGYFDESNCASHNNLVVCGDGSLSMITDQERIVWLVENKPHCVLCVLAPCISEEVYGRIHEGPEEIIDYLGLEDEEVDLDVLNAEQKKCCNCSCNCSCKKQNWA